MHSTYEYHPAAPDILGAPVSALSDVTDTCRQAHKTELANRGPGVRKNAPESAVTVITLSSGVTVCVKEIRRRGILHSAKSLFRPPAGRRSFRNGIALSRSGIGTARPLILCSSKSLGAVTSELLIMEVIPGSQELDRYMLSRIQDNWSFNERRRFVLDFAEFTGDLHAKGVFHSDMKTCNIFVVPSQLPESNGRVRFALTDYDDVEFHDRLPYNRRLKNLVQLFLSTPTALGVTDRLRFLQRYGELSGLHRVRIRQLSRSVPEAARGRKILFVGFEGDVIQEWERSG